MKKLSISKLIAFLVLLLTAVFTLSFCSFAADKLEVHFIDVGQADAALVMTGGHNMLIDGGNADDSQLIYTYLKDHNVSSLDYIICTHGDEDHAGGLPGALSLVQENVKTAITPYDHCGKERFDLFTKKLLSYGIGLTIPKAGEKYTLGSAEFQILFVPSAVDNEDSLVVRLTHGENSFLFCADSCENVEKIILDSGYPVESDVLKVGHHGSSKASCYQWIRAVSPDYAVIEVGADNSYGHPTAEVLSRLKDAGSKIYRTDLNGDIIFTSDGKSLKVSTEKNVSSSASASSKKANSSGLLQLDGDTSGSSTQTRSISLGQTYILNTNTGKFHYPGCKSVNQMKEKNKKEVTDTREHIISQGYVPCQNCHP